MANLKRLLPIFLFSAFLTSSPTLLEANDRNTNELRKPRASLAHEGSAETTTPNDAGGVIKSLSAADKLNLPDVAVLDQDGNRVRFYTDLVKGKTVVINFIFTTCTNICPPLGANFHRVQKEMGDKVGEDVYFISISVDPVTDTPERLKSWGAKFEAGAGWTFVTGEKPQIDRLLVALGVPVGQAQDHPPTVIVYNDVSGELQRAYGLAQPSQLVAVIERVHAGE